MSIGDVLAGVSLGSGSVFFAKGLEKDFFECVGYRSTLSFRSTGATVLLPRSNHDTAGRVLHFRAHVVFGDSWLASSSYLWVGVFFVLRMCGFVFFFGARTGTILSAALIDSQVSDFLYFF